MRALVTGANGLVGSNLVRVLLGRGAGVRALVRPGADRRTLDGLPLEIVEADIRDRDGVYRALRGVDVLHHVAAVYRFGSAGADEIRSAAIDGTVAVLDAASRRGHIDRIVVTSSIAAIGLADRLDRPVDESATWNHRAGEPYVVAKRDAERAALELARARDLPLVVVNPAAVMGFWDRKPTPTGGMVLEFLAGRLAAVVDSGMNPVDAEDVAMGHVLAAERGEIGRRYILAGPDNLTFAGVGALLGKLTGLPPPRFVLPRWPALAGAWLLERAYGLAGRSPPASYRGAKDTVGRYMVYRIDRAREGLGYAPRPARETLARSIAWFLATGRVAPRRVRAMALDPAVRAARERLAGLLPENR